MALRAVQHVLVQGDRRVAVHRTATRAGWLASAGIVDGDAERTVVFCHSAPGAGIFDPDPAETRAREVTLLAVDRPGYGGSDPMPEDEWATVGAAADDIAAVLDRFHVERAGVVGWSAGGRVALALAARRPELVDRVVVAATPAPQEEVPWISPEYEQLLQRMSSRGPRDVHAELTDLLAPVVPEDPFADAALASIATGPADDEVVGTGETRARLGEMLRVAFLQGASGIASDLAGYCLQPWGFEPGDVEAKVLLLYGSRDPIAGPKHGRWWKERLPNSRLEVVPGAGHLLIVPMWRRVLSHLAPGRGHRGRNATSLRNGSVGLDVDQIPAA
jgi:pimeloyl-ACP methyl ester carboxylesterase